MEFPWQVAQRLIVAADFKPRSGGDGSDVTERVLDIAGLLAGSGVIIKVNSVLRKAGYSLIGRLHDLGVGVMADLKVNDIPNTLETDGAMLWNYEPEIVTAMCSVGTQGLQALREAVSLKTKVIGVTVFTSLDETECIEIYGSDPASAVPRLARVAKRAGLPGIVGSGRELSILKGDPGLADLHVIVPGIRPVWSADKGDQERVVTPKRAILEGAHAIVVGRPILERKANSDGLPQSPIEAVNRILSEIQEALGELGQY